MKKIVVCICAGLTILSAGCTGTEKGAGIGAVSGGVIGGIIGHQTGRTAEGVAIGAVTGGILGGVIGHEAEKSSAQPAQPTVRKIVVCPSGHQVDVTGFAPGTRVRCPICNAVFEVPQNN